MNTKSSFATWIAKYPLYVCTAILSAVIIASAAAVGTVVYVRHASLEERITAQESEAVGAIAPAEDRTKYVLREYNGCIGIFEDGDTVPREVLSVYVFTLPQADRYALRIGITVYGEDALCKLIEDFTA